MLAACSRNEMDFQEKAVLNDGNLVEQVIFEAPDIHFLGEDGETRASLSQTGDNSIRFAWEATDTVGIFPEKGSQVFFEMATGVGTNVATFDGGGWALRENANYFCYFPFICDMKLDREAIPISFANQKQAGVSNYENVRYVLASEGKASDSGSLRFTFSMLNTIIRIKAIGLPAGTYANQDEDVPTSAVKLTLFLTPDVDEETAYQMTKVFWENWDSLTENFAPLRAADPAKACEDLAGVPLHDGAARYYREIGLID